MYRVIIYVILSFASEVVNGCPAKCSCDYYALVHTIECSNNDFYAIPNDIPEWSTLLRFDGNYIRTLDLNNFTIRKYFEEFRFRYNEIDTIIVKNKRLASSQANHGCGTATAMFLRISSVNLRGNRLQKLPKCLLSVWPVLKILNLNENMISSLSKLNFDSYVGYSNTLKELYLQNNWISKISRSELYSPLTALRSLEILDVSHNFISEIEPGSLMFLKNLTDVRMNHNYFSWLKDFSFVTRGRKIERINLSNNNIFMISHNAFTGLPRLNSIDLSNNEITCLQPKAWATCQVPLNFSNRENVLRFGASVLGIDHYTVFLHKFFSRNLTYIEIVKVDNNPWTCDCKLKMLTSSQISSLLRPHLEEIQCPNGETITEYTRACP